jgi:type II secretory pathway pseudopilin PulG
MMITQHLPRRGLKQKHQGFALLETMIAIVVLMIGLLAVLATFTLAIGNTQSVHLDAIARQKAAEAMESIFTARHSGSRTFDQLQNVGSGTGIFTQGFTPLTEPGADGLVGTADDDPPATVTVPGSNGTNSPSETISLANFTRQIQISNIANNPNVRQVTVTVKYPVPQGWYRTYQVQALISSFR